MHTIYLKYISEFDAYGIKKEVISECTAYGEIANILLPKELNYRPKHFAPTIGFLLGQDESSSGDEYYSISKSYLQAVMNTGAKVRFLDYDHPYRQMQNCHGAILPGGDFNTPEYFYVDGKILGDKIGKRYYAYRSVIAHAYSKKKPLLGICAGAQMIGALLGRMKMYRCIKDEVSNAVLHRPTQKSEVCMHRIRLIQNTPIFDIMDIEPTRNFIMINSRHNQAMVIDSLHNENSKIKMELYAISDSDGIYEIWGNDRAGILCVQGHPEDLINDPKIQNLYNYIARKSQEYKDKMVFYGEK